MKKLLILCCAFFIAAACKEEPNIDYAIISGKIDNQKGETITINGDKFNKTISLNEDGTFADTLKITSKGYYIFDHGREVSYIYLNAGDNLNVTLDTKQFDETITFSGIGEKENNYLAAKLLSSEKDYIDVPELYSKEESDFLNHVNTIKAKSDAFLKNTKGLSSDFIASEAKSNNYDYLLNLQQYPMYHAHFAKKENVEVSDALSNPLKEIAFNNESDYKNFYSYKALVQNHYVERINKNEDITTVFEELKAINASIIKDDIAVQVSYLINPTNENNEIIFNGVIALSSNEKFKTALSTKYEKIKLLAKGQPSPEFKNYENHKGGKTSLVDLKGKYVYVDVWATWCGPCKREIPFLKEVEAKYHGKNIAFVSTSVDQAKDHEAWVQMVKDKELGGIQLFADNSWKSDFVKNYAIEGIPRFILIDPNGNIVSADAPRPSSPKLIELFNELNI